MGCLHSNWEEWLPLWSWSMSLKFEIFGGNVVGTLVGLRGFLVVVVVVVVVVVGEEMIVGVLKSGLIGLFERRVLKLLNLLVVS